ncbi:MAG: HAD hydrolase-like protein [Gemmatimonadota bacterium]|nr:HAD hydrolase-like protein [Gemmatimonadota bacterium]
MDVPVLLVEFEGVIAETAALRRDALSESLAVEGITVTDTLAAAGAGYCTEDAVRRVRRAAGAPDDETATELARLRAERAFATRAGKGLTIAPAARPTLERLSSCCRLSLVTRASRREVEFVFGLGGLDGLFRPVIALEDAPRPKPDAAPYETALARIAQLFPGQQLRALAVEDHLVGIRAARAAGIACVAVGAFAAHEAVEADAWVESIADLTPERVRELTGVSSGGRR